MQGTLHPLVEVAWLPLLMLIMTTLRRLLLHRRQPQ